MTIRQRLYVDGHWLAKQACDSADASINWLDVAALARRMGCGEPMNACYFGLCDPSDPASAAPVRVLAQALEAAGVSCQIRCEPAESLECNRCGHGWEHASGALLAADLVLQVAEDAASDDMDMALIMADASCVARLERLFARCYPDKAVVRLSPDIAELKQFRMGRMVSLAGATLLRPAAWTQPARASTAARGTRRELS